MSPTVPLPWCSKVGGVRVYRLRRPDVWEYWLGEQWGPSDGRYMGTADDLRAECRAMVERLESALAFSIYETIPTGKRYVEDQDQIIAVTWWVDPREVGKVPS